MKDMRERKIRKDKLIKSSLLLGFVIISTLIFPFSEEKIYSLRIGEIPQKDIIAPFTYKIPKSKEEIEKEKKEILKGITFVLTPITKPSFDIELIKEQLENLDYRTRKKFITEVEKTIKDIENYVIIEDIDTLRKVNAKYVILLEPTGEKIFPVNKIVSPEEIKKIVKAKAEKIFPENKELAFLFEELLNPFIIPNYKVDFEETEFRKEKAISAIKEYKGTIYKGEIIAKAGEPLTKEIVEKLEAMEKAKKKDFVYYLYLFLKRLFIISLITFFAYYTIRFQFANIYKETKLISIVIINSLLFNILTSFILKFTKNPFFVPFAFIPFFFYFVTGREFAIFITLIMAIFVSIYSGFNLFFFIFFTTVGMSGILISKYLRKRYDLLIGFLILTIIIFILGGLFSKYINYELTPLDLVISSVFSSGISILAIIAFLPLHEKIFGLTTDFMLLELISLDHPLLKELELKAPGTFEHSVQISELARIAAEKIGANPLLAKAGGLYHDIGKIENPKFFIENLTQKDKNPHDRIAPSVSAIILQNHVKKGIELAKKYGLPESIIRIIERHHGTLLMGFFYDKAKKLNPDVSEEDFRYKCPKPEKKEEAIIMLLDGIEAKIRSLEKYEYQSIQEAIDSVINHRFSDGQFDECEITRKDMEKIKDAILPRLIHRFHSRVSYPPLKAKEKIVGSK